jgi:hypothetical protein
MSKLVNTGIATVPTGTGGVTIDCGFAPKAVVCFITSRRTSVPRITHSVGCIVGASQACRAAGGDATNGSSSASLRVATDCIGFGAGEILISASISGNDLTLTPASSLADTATVLWKAIGGTDVDVALRTTVFTNGTTTTVNDCGFDPTLLLLGSGGNATLNSTVTNRGEVALGVVVGSTQRAAGLAFVQAAPSNVGESRWMTNRAANTFAFNAWRTNAITVSLVSGGFSINNTDTQAGWAWVLCVRGLAAAVLSSTLPTTAGDVDLTGAGFAPTSALAFALPDTTANDTNQTLATTGDVTSVAYGTAVSGGDQVSLTAMIGYDTSRTGALRSSSTRGLVTLEKTGVNTYANEADATLSFLSDGARFAFSDPHNVAGRFAVLLTDGGLPGPSGPVADSLLFTAQPVTTNVGSTMPAFTVAAVDSTQSDAVDTNFTGTVTLTPVGGSYTGTLAKAAVAGVATFDDIEPQTIGTGFEFDADHGAFATESSDPFDITVPSGGGVTIPLEAEPMATPVLKNTATASKRRIYFNVWNNDGTPWSGSVSTVKPTLNGVTGTEDIVRVAGALHFAQATQAESNTSEPVITAVLAASGSRLAAQGIGLVSETDFATASPSSTAIADTLLGRSIAGGADGGRTVESALASLRNRVVISGGTMTVYDVDDTTPLWTGAITGTPAITESNPA